MALHCPKCLTQIEREPAAINPAWQPASAAPVGTNLLACGGGQMRFMRKDANGQWRNMMNAPKPAPKFWTLIPTPPLE